MPSTIPIDSPLADPGEVAATPPAVGAGRAAASTATADPATTHEGSGTGWNTQAPPGILDLEASGFGRNSYPIEIGYVLPDGETFCSLIKPADSWTHWDASAEQMHHITRASVLRHGRGAAELAKELNQRLAGLTLYSDGWLQDYTWLNVLYEEAGVAPSFKLGHLRTLLTEAEAQRWDALKREVEAELKLDRHRASSDARLLQVTLLRLREDPARTEHRETAPA